MNINKISGRSYTIEMSIRELHKERLERHGYYLDTLSVPIGEIHNIIYEVVDYKGEKQLEDGSFLRQYLFFCCWGGTEQERADDRMKVFGEDDTLFMYNACSEDNVGITAGIIRGRDISGSEKTF